MLRLFAQSDVYQQWRPECLDAPPIYSKQDVDWECESMLGFA
jgi:hypothetical protein